MTYLKERFQDAVLIHKSTGVSTSSSSTNAVKITGSTIGLLPKEAADGLVLEWKLAGTKNAANGSMTFTFIGAGSTLMALVADANTGGDWAVDFMIRFTNPKSQKIIGTLLLDTEDPEVNFGTATANFSSGGEITAYVTAGSGSDAIVCEMCITKKYMT